MDDVCLCDEISVISTDVNSRLSGPATILIFGNNLKNDKKREKL